MAFKQHNFYCLCLMVASFTMLFSMGNVRYTFLKISFEFNSTDIVLSEKPDMYLLCADVISNDPRPCLCFYNSSHVPEHFTFPRKASIKDLKLIRRLDGRCAMTINAAGRLGNLMCEYAISYALSKRNNRPAFMLKSMADVLFKYYNVTLPILREDLERAEEVWTSLELHYWMEDSYANLNDTFIKITGYPYSWTYFNHLRDDIVREFAFSEEVVDAVQKQLFGLRHGRKSVTFVGVHVRRGDYVEAMKDFRRQGTVADHGFFTKATNYFRSKYPDSIFVVASDDLKWCKKNIDNSKKDVYFLGNANITNPIFDMAMLSKCNHSIITIGTYGFWTAYLAGGETVHLTNYSKPDAPWHDAMRYEKLYLPNWIPIAANWSFV